MITTIVATLAEAIVLLLTFAVILFFIRTKNKEINKLRCRAAQAEFRGENLEKICRREAAAVLGLALALKRIQKTNPEICTIGHLDSAIKEFREIRKTEAAPRELEVLHLYKTCAIRGARYLIKDRMDGSTDAVHTNGIAHLLS